MKYALLPRACDSRDTALLNLANNVKADGGQELGVRTLNAGAYLCSLEHGLRGLNLVLSIAEERKFASHTLFFDHEPSWVAPISKQP